MIAASTIASDAPAEALIIMSFLMVIIIHFKTFTTLHFFLLNGDMELYRNGHLFI